MLARTQHHRYKQHVRILPETLGHGERRSISESVENHLLGFAVPYLVDHASDAILPQSWRFQHQGQDEVGVD